MIKWTRILGIIVLFAVVTISISLANPGRIEFEDKLSFVGESRDRLDQYTIGELHKGDTVKVVITDIRGNSPIVVRVAQNVFSRQDWDCYFPGERTFTIPIDGAYYLYIIIPGREGITVLYKGYVEW